MTYLHLTVEVHLNRTYETFSSFQLILPAAAGFSWKFNWHSYIVSHLWSGKYWQASFIFYRLIIPAGALLEGTTLFELFRKS